MPFIGWFIGEMMGPLSGPMEWFGGPEGVEKTISKYVIYISIIAISEFFAWHVRMKAFSTMS